MQTSARRGIQSPSIDRSDRPDLPLHLSYLVAALEKDPSLDQGAASARPTNPGYSRYFYWTTDTKVLYFWDGSSWTGVGSTDTIPIGTIDAKGDLLVGLGDNHIDRLGVGADGQAIIADSAQSTGLRYGAVPITFVQLELATEVNVPTADTYTNVLSIPITPGKWRIAAHATMVRSTGGQMFGKLYDGTNPAWASVAQALDTTGAHSSISLSKQIEVFSNTNVILAIASDGANNKVKAAIVGPNTAGNTATHVEAMQLA